MNEIKRTRTRQRIT